MKSSGIVNLKFNFMKNDFLKNSSQRVLFSALMASALAIGNLAPMHAEVASVQSVMQSVSVKGQVLDGDGIPVIGASILEKGTTNGVITDIDGNYSLNVSSKNAVIVISYIGYKTMELKASDSSLSKVILKEDTEVLDEVVVVGYEPKFSKVGGYLLNTNTYSSAQGVTVASDRWWSTTEFSNTQSWALELKSNGQVKLLERNKSDNQASVRPVFAF